MEGLHQAVTSGKTRAIGIANCYAWLLCKVDSPIVGATKVSQVEGVVRATALTLTGDEVAYLEELYVPHALVGVMAQNVTQAGGNANVKVNVSTL